MQNSAQANCGSETSGCSKYWRHVVAVITSGFLVTLATGALALEISKPKAVVELFTSQGCSSCPPADAALRQMNQQDDILGLALHVDYWDRLGWKDTFASPEHTERQRSYARPLKVRAVYTPQAVINGRTHVVGSRKEQILQAARGFSDTGKGLVANIDVVREGDALKITISDSALVHHATLYAFYFNPLSVVAIKRGENAGREITYSNIVRKIETIGMVGDAGFSTMFGIADIREKGFGGCALVLQTRTANGQPGPILGATVLKNL